jgi:hypothetical protein
LDPGGDQEENPGIKALAMGSSPKVRSHSRRKSPALKGATRQMSQTLWDGIRKIFVFAIKNILIK